MAKKRKANSIAKPSATAESDPAASDEHHSIECGIPTKKANASCKESGSIAPAKKKSKQKKKSIGHPNTKWEEETVEESTFNIDQYRNPLEQEEHWELRRAFLEKNQQVLPQDELIGLAQVYINVQLLGCRYPPETMKLVDNLSEGIGRDYHCRRAFMLKRTFVSASDAAASKVRRDGPVVLPANGNSEPLRPVGPVIDGSQSIIPPFMLNCLRNDLIILNNNFHLTAQTFNSLNNGLEIQLNSCSNRQGMHECIVEVSGIPLAKAVVNDNKRARGMATDNALKFLSQYCYSLTRKKQASQLDGIEVIKRSDCEKEDDTETGKLDTGNVGFQLLTKLGWNGGCLGVRGDGIVNPLTVDKRIGRKGLGLKGVKLNHDMINEKLMDLRDGKIEDHYIVFSNEYSKEDRKHIHE
uniref:G-patch domain-containing protein n=1 Tax=Anopheles maculatus TaxID=74869 RepID=A0A182TBV6_9DIPT